MFGADPMHMAVPVSAWADFAGVSLDRRVMLNGDADSRVVRNSGERVDRISNRGEGGGVGIGDGGGVCPRAAPIP